MSAIPIFKTRPSVIKLDDASLAPKEVQLLRTGTYNHDVYGKFVVDKKTLSDMIENWKANVRGVDLAIDYSHENEKIAAGWIADLILTNDGTELWAKVDWTPKGKQVLVEKEFRYLSPEFNLEYEDKELGQTFGATLLGAGLTNRPFIKRMAPTVELTELTEGELEDMKTLQEAITEIANLTKKLSEMEVEKKKLEEGQKAMDGMSPEQMMAKIKELEALVAQLKGEKEASEKKAMEDKACAEKKSKFDKLLTEGKAVEAQREAFMKDDMEKFISLSEKPSLNAQGSGGDSSKEEKADDKSETPAQDKVIELAEKLVAEKKVKSLSEGISAVLADPANKKIRADYEMEVSIG